MKHYLVYHSDERMGSTISDDPDREEFSIVTKKLAAGLPGNVVWLVSGSDTPRRYRLRYWFLADDVEEIDGQEFAWEVSGNEGIHFGPGIPLNDLPWFADFKKANASFSLGLQPIAEEFVTHILEVTRSAGFALPPGSTDDVYEGDSYEAGTPAEQEAVIPMPPERRSVVAERIVRDTAVSARVKHLHDHRCQVCGIRLETPAGPYAEGAHVQPLGSPHDGPDIPANVLCLCPNHHVLFDGLAFAVADDLSLVGIEGSLRTADGHTIGLDYLRHHCRRFEEARQPAR